MALDHQLLDAHALAIINPLRVRAALWADLPTAPLEPAELASKPDTMPLLLDLRGMDDSARVDLLHRADRHHRHPHKPMLTVLLKTDAGLPRVQAHLRRQLLQTAPDGSRFLLRWHDSQVFRHLRWLLTPAQMQTLSGAVTTWTWCDDGRRWQTHAVVSAPQVLSNLRLSADQYAVVGRMGVLNRTLAQLRRNAPDIAVDEDTARRADRYLQRAYDLHGLTDEADCRLFAEQGLRYGPHIHQHPQLVRRLAMVRDQGVTYVGACADLDPAALSASDHERDHLRKESCT